MVPCNLRFRRLEAISLMAALLLAACGPGERQGAIGSQPSEGRPPKSLTIALPAEPANIAFPLMSNVPTGSAGGGDIKLAVHHRLANYDDRGGTHPMLAAELPTRASGSWLVRPDGTMQTTYRLRNNVVWHDGTPLTSGDFAFTIAVVTDPAIPVSTRLGAQIARVDTPDDYTLVYEWAVTYPFAHALVEDETAPLPRHLLEDTFRTDKERFLQLRYWTDGFVGTGPFRVAQWEPGSHIVLSAFDHFYLGKPKLDRLEFRFMPEESSVVAALLAGAVDGTVGRALDFNEAVLVRDTWERAGRKPVFIVQTTHWRLSQVQFRPELVQPRDLLDVRVRRGLLHAIDRQALIDTFLAGQSPISHLFIPPDDVKWDWVKDGITRYDYDVRLAQALLAEAGWARAADGALRDRAGERVTLRVTVRPGEPAESEAAVMANFFKAVGAIGEFHVLSPGEARDSRVITQFPAFTVNANPLVFGNTMQLLEGRECPSEQTRWVGRNHGCYQNPQWDRLVEGLRVAIDPSEEQRLWRELARTYTDELPVLPLYFSVHPTIFREGVTGTKGDTRPRTAPSWNAHEWDIL